MSSFKKLMSDYGIGALVALFVIAYAISMFAGYLTNKGGSGMEYMTGASVHNNTNPSKNTSAVKPSEPLGNNEVFSAVRGISSPSLESADSSNNYKVQNPADLLPKDNNSEWAHLNPSGKGELSSVNMLQAGYQIGIDTVGQTLRNANQQLRSEPANPQLYVGPWNTSTIEPDFMRPPLEIGTNAQ